MNYRRFRVEQLPVSVLVMNERGLCVDQRLARKQLAMDLLHQSRHHRLVLRSESCTRCPQRVSQEFSL